MPKIRNQVKLYISLILLTLLIITVTGEIFARIFLKDNNIPPLPEVSTIDPYSANPYIMWTRPFLQSHIPYAQYFQSRSYYKVKYNINSAGFRGAEIQPKKKGQKRLAIIGDSIVEGHGCDFQDTFSYHLNEKVRQYNWDVVNLGVQGASPLYFALNLPRYLSSDPDAIMIVMFENDLYDDRIQEKQYFSKPLIDIPEQLFIGHAHGGANIGHTHGGININGSKLYLLLRRAFHKIFQTKIEKMIVRNNGISIVNKEQKAFNKLSPWLVAPSMFEKQWKMSSGYLDHIVEELKIIEELNKKKIPVFMVFLGLGSLVPGKNEAYANHTMALNNKVKSWSNANGLPFISLVPLIKKLLEQNPVTDIMINDDGHPTPKTQKRICDQLWAELVEHKK